MLWPLFIYVMADVIAKWQMELPLRVGDGTLLLSNQTCSVVSYQLLQVLKKAITSVQMIKTWVITYAHMIQNLP